MITINIVCVGNLKESFWKDAIGEYSKRISAFAKLNIFEVKESNYGNSAKEIEIAKKEEAERLKNMLLEKLLHLKLKAKVLIVKILPNICKQSL